MASKKSNGLDEFSWSYFRSRPNESVDVGDDNLEDIWQLRQLSTNKSAPGPVNMNDNDSRNFRSQNPPNTAHGVSDRTTTIPSTSSSVALNDANANQSPSKSRRYGSFRKVLKHLLQRSRTLKDSSQVATIKCLVVLLDGTYVVFNLPKSALGSELFEAVTNRLGLEEKCYFGLAYFINKPSHYEDDPTLNPFTDQLDSTQPDLDSLCGTDPNTQNGHWSRSCTCPGRVTNCISQPSQISYAGFNPFLIDVPFWLQMDQQIMDQCEASNRIFYFQVKFYPQHPDRILRSSITRRQYCLQLRHHLIMGRLLGSFESHVILGALIAQMDMGDAPSRTRRSQNNPASCSRSLISDLSSRRLSLSNRSNSLAQSLNSTRACSLAEPEDSNDSIVWNPQPTTNANTNTNGNRTDDVDDPVADCQPKSMDTASGRTALSNFRTVSTNRLSLHQLDSASIAYLECLPHLARTPAQSITQLKVHDDDNDDDDEMGEDRDRDSHVVGLGPSLTSSLALGPTELDLLPKMTKRFSPGWPYPRSEAHYCPVLLGCIERLHRSFRRMSQSEAECLFLENAKKFALYGLELHPIKNFVAHSSPRGPFRTLKSLARSFSDRLHVTTGSATESGSSSPFLNRLSGSMRRLSSMRRIPNSLTPSSDCDSESFPFRFDQFPGFDYSVGIYHGGLILLWGQVRLRHFGWSSIGAMSLHRDEFHLRIRDQPNLGTGSSVHSFKIKFSSPKLAKRFFRTCVEHHKFFRIQRQPITCRSKPRISLPSRPAHLPVKIPTLEYKSKSRSLQNPIAGPSTKLYPMEGPSSDELVRSSALRQRNTIGPIEASCSRTTPTHANVHVESMQTDSDTSDRSQKRSNGKHPLSDTSTLVQNQSSKREKRDPSANRRSFGHSWSSVARQSRASSSSAPRPPPSFVFSINQPSPTSVEESCIEPVVEIENTDGVRSNTPSYAEVPTCQHSSNFIPAQSIPTIKPAVPLCRRPPLKIPSSVGPSPQSFMFKNMQPAPIPPPVPPPPIRPAQFSLELCKALSVAIVPTYSAVITPNGQIMRLPTVRSPAQSPVETNLMTTVDLNPLVLSSIDQQQQQLAELDASTKGDHPSPTQVFLIPTIPTRVIRFMSQPIELNQFGILSESHIRVVNASEIPLVSTRSLFLKE